MANRAIRIISLSILMLVLAIPALAQNTKGDKPTTTRETRFKTPGKQKSKRIKSKRGTTSSLRAYKPRKKSKGGERAGSALGTVYRSRPSERPRNVYPQSGQFVNNRTKSPKGEGRRNVFPQTDRYVNNNSTRKTKGDPERKRVSKTTARITPRSATGRVSNVYPQSGRFVSRAPSRPADRQPGRKRRVVTRSASRSFTARRSVNAWAIFPKSRQKSEKAYTKDIAGRRLRTKNFETKRPGIIQSPGGSVLSRSNRRRNISPSSGRISAQPGRGVYSQSNRYVGNYARRPKSARSNRIGAGGGFFSQGSADKGPGKKRRIAPRTASRPFMARRSTNMWARFPRPKKKGERAITTDIAGHPLRTKNFETERPRVMINPTARPHKVRKQVGDRAYQGGGGGFATRSRSGKAWTGDVSGRRIRKNYTSKKGFEGRPIQTPEKRRVGMRYQGERFPGNIQGRRFPGDQGEGFTGALKSRRALKGGGSVSGRLWNNRRQAIPARGPGIGGKGVGYSGNLKAGQKGFNNQGEEYTGNLKTRRPLKGGGSVSGRLWNNRRQAIPARSPGIGGKGVGYSGNLRAGRKGFNNQGEEYTGNLKTRRPLKGGGSVSGRLWNNRQQAIPARSPGMGGKGVNYSGNIRAGRRGFNNQGEEYPGDIRGGVKVMNDQGEEYTGHFRARRPLKGGGSVSGKLWNNRQTPVPARNPGIGGKGIGYSGNIRGVKVMNDQGEEYTGHFKARRPLKGGGSVSGKLWNNRQTPLPKRQPGMGGWHLNYTGFIRGGTRVMNDQGEEYTGHIKTRRPLKGGGSVSGKLWNNRETPIAVRTPSPAAAKAGNYTGNIRGGMKVMNDQGEEYTGDIKLKRKYVQNPNAAEDAPLKMRPRTTYDVDGLQVKVKRPEYGTRKNAPEGSIPGLKPSKATREAGQYALGMRAYKYVKNPGSAEGALKVREVGKAFARATDYQGNIKMRKFELFGKRQLHPDAQFVKINKNNVDEEKDMLTNFKLWWSRLFRKNETLPDHLKDKRGKPRYDRGEQGLWYD